VGELASASSENRRAFRPHVKLSAEQISVHIEIDLKRIVWISGVTGKKPGEPELLRAPWSGIQMVCPAQECSTAV
jgi:hypothetical protein